MSELRQTAFQKYVQEHHPPHVFQAVLGSDLAVFFCKNDAWESFISVPDRGDPVVFRGIKSAVAYVDIGDSRFQEINGMMAEFVDGSDIHPRLRGRFLVRSLIYSSDDCLCVATLDSHGEVSVVTEPGDCE